MKISKNMISFPPYLSTSWKNVRELHCKEGKLIITLDDGSSVSIPNLDEATITRVFEAHAAYLEGSEKQESTPKDIQPQSKNGSFQLPFDMIANGGGDFQQMNQVLQHNPDQADAPDLPGEMLEKICSVAEILAPEDPEMIPEPVEGCNCFHCQITRAIQKGIQNKVLQGESVEQVEMEEEVTDEDLSFRSWDIEQTGDKIFRVTNPLDGDEQYFVHLKDPIGCTCGQKNCEHIEAVLKS